ncbi:MAG: glycosyltransferase family 4 protein [Verrucomicrobiota bacterium]
MKINICTGPNFPVPPLQGGGMARAWYGLAHNFAEHGNKVTILARAHSQQPAQSQEGHVTIQRYGGFNQSSSLALNLTKDFFYAASVTGRLPAADITVLNDFWLPVLLPRLAKSAGKVVVSVNRMPKQQYSLYRKCDAFVCPNEQVAKRLRSQNPELTDKIHVIPNPYESSSFSAGTMERSGLLYVGRIHPEKGLHLLVEAIKKLAVLLPETSLTVIGSAAAPHGGGGESYLRQIKALAAGQAIHWHGPEYDPDQLRKAYQSHQFFIYPSLSENGETFGIAPVEAMACGCVPVTSQLAVFSNFIKPGHNGLSFPHQDFDAADSLAAILAQAFSDSNTIKMMSDHAIKTAQSYSMPAVGSRFLKLFQTLQVQS